MSELDLHPNDLILCVDETGSESLSDPKYPVFGFGGCAVTGSAYHETIEKPWREIKREHFGLVEGPLHATDISKRNTAGLAAVAEYFRTSRIARFAMVLTTATVLSGDDTDPYRALALSFSQQLDRVLREFSYYRLVFAFEQSKRGDRLARRDFSEIQPVLDGPDGPFHAPVERCFIPKTLAFPPIEIADFVAYTAGRQARALTSGGAQLAPEFLAVFSPAPERFAEIVFTSSIHVTRKAGRDG